MCEALPTDAARPPGMWRWEDRSPPEGDASKGNVVKTSFLGFLIPKAVCQSGFVCESGAARISAEVLIKSGRLLDMH